MVGAHIKHPSAGPMLDNKAGFLKLVGKASPVRARAGAISIIYNRLHYEFDRDDRDDDDADDAVADDDNKVKLHSYAAAKSEKPLRPNSGAVCAHSYQ